MHKQFFVKYVVHPKDKSKPKDQQRRIGCVVAGKVDDEIFVGWSKRDAADAWAPNGKTASYHKKRGREIAVDRLKSKAWQPVFDPDTGTYVTVAHKDVSDAHDKLPFMVRDDIAKLSERALRYFKKTEEPMT